MKIATSPTLPRSFSRDTPARHAPTWLSLAALALGGLAIGTTEFASMGLLPDFATDLAVSIPHAGVAISAYALGVVIGAPALAVGTARWPRRRLVLALAGAVALTNASSALAWSFPTFLLTRFLSGVPHGAYFGTAAVLAAGLVPPARRARAIAATMSGLMVANIIGVPAATWLGATLGWRTAYLAVAGIAVLTVVAVAQLVPAAGSPSPESAPAPAARAELAAFRRPQVWLTLLVIAAGFGGTFAVYSYITPILTEVSGFTVHQVPLALAAYGVGMTAGNHVGGRLAERMPIATVVGSMVAGTLVLAAFTRTAHSPIPATITLFGIGFMLVCATPALMTRLMEFAPDSRTVAAATYHSAFNVANALGATLGGAVLAAGGGYTAPAAVGAVLPVIGLAVFLASVLMQYRPVRLRHAH
jgi:DHA1 family inner membrane transport protein